MTIYYIHLLIPALVLLPNWVYGALQPKDTAPQVHVPLYMTIIEKIGQIGMVALPVFLPITYNLLFAVIMAVVLALYYAAWIPYFKTRNRKALYSPFLFIPLPLATLPVVYFLLSAVLFNTPTMYVAWVLLAIGHLGVTYKSRV